MYSTHGKVGRGRTFFFRAFGRSEEEFEELIRMPEEKIGFILLTESNINFSKFGWVNEASKLIGIAPQKVSNFIKNICLNFMKQNISKENQKQLNKLKFLLFS